MMSYINETDFVIENKKLVYPEIVADGLQLYYDAKGKRDTDYHRDTMLDMSGNKNHGKLHNFAYEKHSGYKDGLVFDYIDDKLVRPSLNLQPDDFTFMLNGNIVSFSPDGTVKRVQDGEVIESKGFNLIRNGDFSDGLMNWSSPYSQLTLNSGRLNITPKNGPQLVIVQPYNSTPENKYYVKLINGDTDMLDPYIYIGNFTMLNKNTLSAIHTTTSNATHISIGRVIYTNGTYLSFDSIVIINLTQTFGAGKEPTKEQMDEIINRFGFIPNAQDLIDHIEYKGNYLGDMENIIDGLYKTEVLSGTEIFTDKADDSVVHVDIDGNSVGGGSGKNLIENADFSHGTKGWTTEGKTELASEGIILESIVGRSDLIQSRTVIPVGTYTLQVWYEVLEGQTPYLFPRGGSTAREGDSYFLDSQSGHATTSITVTSPSLLPSFRYASGSPENHLEGKILIKKIQLEEGSVATAYEPPAPTPDYPIEIHSLNDFDVVSSVGGRNLLLGSKDYTGTWINKAQWTVSSDTHKGTLIASRTGSWQGLGQRLNVFKGEQYTFSAYVKSTSTRVMLYVTNQSDSAGLTPTNKFITLEPNTWTYVVCVISVSSDGVMFPRFEMSTNDETVYVSAMKLEKGNKSTDWTPAPEDITESDNHPLIDKTNILLREPLRSVGDVKDRLFRDSDGLWKIERNVGEVVLDGTETWNFSNGLANNYQFWTKGFGFVAKNDRDNRNVRSTHLKTSTFNDRSRAGIGYSVWVSESPSELAIMVPKDKESHTDTTKLRAWLSEQNANGNPVKVLCQLDTPTVETLDQELQDKLNNIVSYKDSNYVYTIVDKTNILPSYVRDNLKPTLHAKFLYNNWYKEDRVINNLMIYNRALTNEEMLQNYKTIKRRWGM